MALFTNEFTGNTMEIPDHNVDAYVAAGWVPADSKGGRVRGVEPVEDPEKSTAH